VESSVITGRAAGGRLSTNHNNNDFKRLRRVSHSPIQSANRSDLLRKQIALKIEYHTYAGTVNSDGRT
jgi:hypothetical protein